MFHEKQKLDVKLIRLVRKFPFLYDYGHEKYMDLNAREVAWQMIGDEMKKPAADCKVRWINIRDVHRRILRKILTTGARPNKMYKYESELAFMKQYYKDVAAASISCDDEEKDSERNVMCDNDNDIQDGSSDNDSDKPIKKIKAKRRKNKKRKEVLYEDEKKETLSTSNDTQQIIGDFDISDPIDSFLLSIGATLKTFSPYHLNVAKSKIFAVVQEHDLQQIVERERQGQSDVKTSVSDDSYIVCV